MAHYDAGNSEQPFEYVNDSYDTMVAFAGSDHSAMEVTPYSHSLKAVIPTEQTPNSLEMKIDPKHVDLVHEQVPQVSRARVIAALEKTNGDIVDAVQELIMNPPRL